MRIVREPGVDDRRQLRQQGRIGQAVAEGDEELLLAAGPGEVVVAGSPARPGVGEGRLAVEVMDAGRQPGIRCGRRVQPPYAGSLIALGLST